MDNLIFTLNTVAPVFLIVFLGVLFNKQGLLNQNFISISSKFVFSVTLPCLIFAKLSVTNFTIAFDLKQIIFVYIGVTFFFIFSWFIAVLLTKNGKDQATFIQGSFRSNFAIVGFAIILNLFGNHALVKASILLAFVMPLYNILAVIALTAPITHEKKFNSKKTIFEIITNPLIIAVLVALPFSFFNLHPPQVFSRTIDYLADLTLPLALLGIGASLNFESIRKDSKLAFISTLIKIIIVPATLTYVAYRIGFSGEDIGVMFILFATPTAIATFIMAEAMGANSELAGNIILISTLGSIFTISMGIFILKSLHLF